MIRTSLRGLRMHSLGTGEREGARKKMFLGLSSKDELFPTRNAFLGGIPAANGFVFTPSDAKILVC